MTTSGAKLAGRPIIPADGQSRAPCALAFTGKRGDYWGDWKIRISTEGLSQNDQSRYRAAGVTSALPNPETSRTFLGWLATPGSRRSSATHSLRTASFPPCDWTSSLGS